MIKQITKSLAETLNLARELAPLLRGGDVVGLTGDLGVGKSTFVSATVERLHGFNYSNSPTFTIVHQYDNFSPHIFHIDLYRIEDEKNLSELGIDEFLYSNGISLIEWFPNLGIYKPKEYLEITIKCGIDGAREFTFHGAGKRGEEILNQLRRCERDRHCESSVIASEAKQSLAQRLPRRTFGPPRNDVKRSEGTT